MVRFFYFFVGCLVFTFMGCASASMFKSPGVNANYGPQPIHYKKTIQSYYEDVLFDPYSAKYKFGELTKAYMNRGVLGGGDIKWLGYAIDVKINAKNKYGGYVGYENHLILFDGEKIHAVDPLVTEHTFHRVY